MFKKEPKPPQLESETPTIQVRTKEKAKHHAQAQINKTWEEKPLHGKYPEKIGEKDVVQDMTNKRLKTDGLKSETEGFIVASQDQAIKTNCY